MRQKVAMCGNGLTLTLPNVNCRQLYDWISLSLLTLNMVCMTETTDKVAQSEEQTARYVRADLDLYHSQK